MKENNTILKVTGNLIYFSFLIYLIIMGQKNLGPVKWVADILNITNLRPVGLCIMIIAILGLLLQLYHYNKKFQ